MGKMLLSEVLKRTKSGDIVLFENRSVVYRLSVRVRI